MFRLHKNRGAKSGEKIDFSISHIKAEHVPRDWDKLLVTLINVETGKTIVKSGKTVVHNGICQWSDSFLESIWVSQDEFSKKYDDCHFMLRVATGSSRSGVLGEAIVNMTNYAVSGSASIVSLPLKKCSYGTILQVKIECLTPITTSRSGELTDANTHMENLRTRNHDLNMYSDGCENKLDRSTRSSCGRDLDSTLLSSESGSREASFSTSGSHLSFGSAEGSIHIESVSPRNNFSGNKHCVIGKQDSTNSKSSASSGNCTVEVPSLSNHSLSHLRNAELGSQSHNDRHQEFSVSSSRPGSSKNLLETAEDTTKEIHAEAKMWERNARKLMHDLEISKKELFDQSITLSNLNMDFLSAEAERDGFKTEIEKMKLLLMKAEEKQAEIEDLSYQDDIEPQIQKEMAKELRFQKESNASLALQLKRSQESNVELVSVLQELEDTIEKQKVEIEKLLALQSNFKVMEDSIDVYADENRTLMLQLKQVQASEKNLLLKVQDLERGLEEKNNNKDNDWNLIKPASLETTAEYNGKLFAEEESVNLDSRLSKSPEKSHCIADASLAREIEILKEKVQELEKDCNELTEENLELLYKLKQANKNSVQNYSLEDESEEKIFSEKESKDPVNELKSLKMEVEVKNLMLDLTEKKSEIAALESDLQSKEEEICFYRGVQSELQSKCSDLEEEKRQLKVQMEEILIERESSSKLINDLRNDVKVLGSSVNAHVSTNNILERKSLELENINLKLEASVSEFEQENRKLSSCVSCLEAELKCSNNEEISNLKIQMETGKEDLIRKLNEMQNRLSEVQDQFEYLRRANPKLQATVESLIEECNTLQKSNGELKKQNLELRECRSLLETKLKESQKKFAECSQRIKDLEEKFSYVLEDFASKAIDATSELEELREENQRQNENIMNELLQVLANKSKLESALQEYETKLQTLMGEITTSTQKEKLLMMENEEVSKSLENYEKNEVKFQARISDLELKLSASECECQKLIDEYTRSKDQLQKIGIIQDELLASRNELETTNYEKEKLVSNIILITKEYEDLKTENKSLIEKVFMLQMTISELEDFKHDRLSLEENLLQVKEAKEALSSENTEFENELRQIRILNSQFQHKIEQLEEEKSECLKKSQSLEAELKLMKEEKQKLREPRSTKVSGSKVNTKQSPVHKDSKLQKNASQNPNNKMKPTVRHGQVQELVKDPQNSFSNQIKRQVDGDCENDLYEAMEINNNHKLHPKPSTDDQNNEVNIPKILAVSGEDVANKKFEQRISSLELELKDLQERYFNMSLKYAEVESQREELVMKFKVAKTGKSDDTEKADR